MTQAEDRTEAVRALVTLASMNAIKLVDKMADVFESDLLRDEFFTGAMVGAILRDMTTPLREG